MEFGSPNQWINIWSRWNRTHLQTPPPKCRGTSQRFLPKFRLKAKYYLEWIHPSVLPVIPEFVYLCSLEEIFQQNSRMGLWIAGSSWTMRVSQRSSATWTALVHTSCLALSKSDHYPWALLFKRSSTRSVKGDCVNFLLFLWSTTQAFLCELHDDSCMNHFEYKTLKDLPSELVRFEIVPFSKINPNDYMTISIRGVTHYSNGELDYQESGKGSSWDQVIWKCDSVSETVAFLRTPIPPAFAFA